MGKLNLCVLDSCSTNSSLVNPRHLKLHRFPSDPHLKSNWEKWIQDVGGLICKDFVATKATDTLCDKHFKPSDYLNTKLHSKAVPSIPPCNLQPIADQRKRAYTVAVFKSPMNGQPVGENETSQQPGLDRLNAQNTDPVDFECPVRAQKSLDMASDEAAKTKRKLESMQLKYVRATRRIKTLTDILNQLKEEKDIGEDCEIKVCSSCRKVNVCRFVELDSQ